MNLTYGNIALIPVVTILVNMIKVTGVSKKFYPLISLGLGIIFGFIFITDGDWRNKLMGGIVIGIGASGLYSNGKEMIGTVNGNKK